MGRQRTAHARFSHREPPARLWDASVAVNAELAIAEGLHGFG
jgi:hypothetical protein